MRPANLAQQTPPPGRAAPETRANRRPLAGQPPPPRPSPEPQVPPGLGGGAEGEGRPGGWVAAPARVGGLPTPAARRRSEGARACVCLCLALARSSAAHGGAAQVSRVPGSSPAPGPCDAPPAHPSQTSGPLGLAQATPVFASPPADQQGERGVWVQTCQCHFQREKRGPTPQDPLVRKSEVYFLGDVEPSAPFQVRNGKEEASENINLPTGREAPNLSDCKKTRTSTFITSLLPLLPS